MFEATNADGKGTVEITLVTPEAMKKGTFVVNKNEGFTGETEFEMTYDNWKAEQNIMYSISCY